MKKHAANTQIDWDAWTPQQRATLLFVVRDGQILLIRKLRGLGAGKINGPGGRIDEGETPLMCAIREVQEELCVTPVAVGEMGVLRFQFADSMSILVHVFRASDCVGEPRQTDEAIPLWTPLDAIPYDSMWADDRLWLPRLLAGQPFDGWFVFDEDNMLDHRIDTPPGLGC